MIERGIGSDPRFQQPVDQSIVEIETGGVHIPGTLGVGVDTQLLHQPEVLGPPVVVIAGDITGLARQDLARRV